MARAIWKGVIRFGDHEVPVKLYSAAQDHTVRFRLLHAGTGRPVKQRMVNPETGEVVPYDEIRRGYELEEGTFVVLDDEELEALQPEKSREIESLQFQAPAVIDHRWYDRPYHLGPDGDPEPYFALVSSLEEPFDPEDFEDEYRSRVLELIEAKAEGEAIELRRPEKKRAAGDLAASLEASIAAMEERRSA